MMNKHFAVHLQSNPPIATSLALGFVAWDFLIQTDAVTIVPAEHKIFANLNLYGFDGTLIAFIKNANAYPDAVCRFDESV